MATTDLNKVEYVRLPLSEKHLFEGVYDDRKVFAKEVVAAVSIAAASLLLLALTLATGSVLLGISTLVPVLCAIPLIYWYEGTCRFLPPRARAEFRARCGEIKQLRERADRHNNAFSVQQHHQEMLTGGDPEKQAALCAYWESQRAELQGEIDAVIGEIKRIGWNELSEMRSRRPLRQVLRARRKQFRQEVKTLLKMERNLGAFSTDGYQGTRDLTPYVAVAAKRRELEEQRDELGLPKKALPPSRMVKLPMLPKASAARS